jgi:hypothetical protein
MKCRIGGDFLIKECSNCDNCVKFFGNTVGCQEGIIPENSNGWACKYHIIIKPSFYNIIEERRK